MPVMSCTVNGKPGHKYGENGKCYTGEDSEAKAKEQGRAIKAAQHNAVRKAKRN